MASAEEERMQEAKGKKEAKVVPNPLLLGLSPSDYVLRAVSRVRSSELEQAILLIPFLDALRLLQLLCSWLKKDGNTELLSRVAILICRVHLQQLMATPSARAILIDLQKALHSNLNNLKDIWGFNVAAMDQLKRNIDKKRSLPALDIMAASAAKLKKRGELS